MKPSTPVLSIIIPLYNTERYISQCIRSIFTDSVELDMFEIVVVNDGSTDSSAQIVESLSTETANIRLIQQENRGVSVARMTGLAHAKGDYVWFVDSDDLVVNNAIGRLLSEIDTHPDIDLFIAPMLLGFDNEAKNVPTHTFQHYQEVIGKELLKKGDYLLVGPPHFIIRRSLFNNPWLGFPEGLRYEDEYFCRVLLYLGERALLLPVPLYIYRQWEGSHMHSLGVDSAYDIVAIYKQLDSFLNTVVKDEDNGWFRYNILSFLFECLTRTPELNGSEEFRSFLKNCLPFIRKERRKYLCHMPGKDRFLSALMVWNPKMYSSFRISYLSFKTRSRGK